MDRNEQGLFEDDLLEKPKSNTAENKDHSPKESLAKTPSWTSFAIQDSSRGPPLSTILFDSYIVIILNDFHTYDDNKDKYVMKPKIGLESPLTLLAVDLRDNSVQETQIHDSSFLFAPVKSGKLPYTLTKYGDNQILRYAVTRKKASHFSLLTIESFQLKCENFNVEKSPGRYFRTAQVYDDFLYVIGGMDRKKSTENVWRFDIKNRQWEEVKSTGEFPNMVSISEEGSYLYEDNLYFYGAVHEKSLLFALNLKSMNWTKITQDLSNFPRKENLRWKNSDQTIYQGNLLFMHEYHKNELRCWNISTNSMRTFPINPFEPSYISLEHPIVYNNQLFLFRDLQVYILNLEEVGLRAEETEEDKSFKYLFMNKEGSDVTFKVQEKLIPAHKEVLIKRSKYFAALFNSGMSESREDVIEIEDCDSDLFQQYLRFLYTREVQLNEDLAMKLIQLADKYVQNDLSEKCLDFLKFTIKSDNLFKRLDFAYEQNPDLLKDFYTNYLKNNININSLSKLFCYLEKLPEVKPSIINFIVKNSYKVYKIYEKDWSFYENFLIKNVDMSTISLFVNFIYRKYADKNETSEMPEEAEEEEEEEKYKEEESEDEEDEEEEEQIRKNTLRLNQACFDFTQRNIKEIHQKGVIYELPNKFLGDLALSVMNNSAINVT